MKPPQRSAVDVFRLQRQPLHRLEGRVEAFDVADLQHQSAPLGQRDELIGLGGIDGQRLLDQHGDAARQEIGGDGVMGEGRGGDHGRVHQRHEGQVAGVGPRVAAEGDGLGLGGVRVGDADQLHVGQRGQDAGVFLAQVADADHPHPQTLHAYPPTWRAAGVSRLIAPHQPAHAGRSPRASRRQRRSAAARRAQPLVQRPRQGDVERMAGTVGGDVAAQVHAEQRQVADDVEDLVPGRLVGVAQAVGDRPARAEHQQVGRRRSRAEALPPQLLRLGFEDEGAARGDALGELARRDDGGVDLPADRRLQAVIEEIADGQVVVRRRVQGQAGAGGRNDQRLVHGVDGSPGRLQRWSRP